jgi:hypothetical protein
MHDRASSFAVFEEQGCNYSNNQEQWLIGSGVTSGRRVFENAGRNLLALGISCGINFGSVSVFGYPDRPGNCVNWIPNTP